MSTIDAVFLSFAGIVALADWQGPGHDWGGLAVSVALFLTCRFLGPRGWRRLLTAALVFSGLVAALAVAQVALWMPRARGPFSSPNFLGAYAVLMFFLAAVLPPLAGNRWSTIAAAANLLSLALSQSRGALMALGAGLVVLGLQNRRWRLWAALAAITAVNGIFFIRPDSTNPRMAIWSLGWQAAQQRMVLGWGQGGVSISGLDRFYSIPLEWLIAGGIPSVALGVWLLIAAWRADPALRPFLAAWLVQGLVLFGHPATYVPLIAVLAYLSGRGGRDDQRVPGRACRIDEDGIVLGAGDREAVGAKQLQLAVLGGREAHPLENVLVDQRNEAGRIVRPGDRQGEGDTETGDAESETGEKRAKTVHGALQG
jgi:hypothetical protein